MRNKVVAVLVALTLIFVFGLVGCSSDDGKSDETKSTPVENTDSGNNDGADSSNDQAEDAKYSVTIDSAVKGKDYDGNDAVIVTYSFTNNSDEATSFMVAIMDKAYQNGVQLSSAFVLDGVDSDASMKDIKPGGSIEVQEAYELDDSSDVTIECSEAFSFSSEIIAEKVFSL